jgi:hypothetical protein
MSSLKVHAIQGAAASAALYPVMGLDSISFGLASVLIDVDHVIEYVRDTKSLKVTGVFTYCYLIEKNLDINFLVFNAFHTFEFLALILLLSIPFPALKFIFAGFLFHMAVDITHVTCNLRKPFLRAYSVIEYLLRSQSGKYLTSVRELVRVENLNTDKLDNVNGWLDTWNMR